MTETPAPTPAPAVPAPSTTPETPPQEDDSSGDGEVGGGKPLTPPGNLNLVDDVLQTGNTPDNAGNDAKEPLIKSQKNQ